jgi:hypothetical protein
MSYNDASVSPTQPSGMLSFKEDQHFPAHHRSRNVSQSDTTTRFGRITPPDMAWLAQAPEEPMLEPELAIVDTHHHL